jgi:mannan endo-1,4-beta-mannosidase
MKKLMNILFVTGLIGGLISLSFANEVKDIKDDKKDHFVKIENGRFKRSGKPYYFVGANFWQGMNLGDKRNPKNRQILLRELDRLKERGITQLRVLALSEGPSHEPYRVVPAVQNSPGVFDEHVLLGLDFLLAEMKKRHMTAVMVLSNFWPWSGGFSQWVSWEEGSSIPYPPPHPGGSWSVFQEYSSRFYTIPQAVRKQQEAVKRIITRVNTITGIPYSEEPTIMSWQLANEPRGGRYRKEFLEWIKSSAKMIRHLAPHHLISLGSEGETLSPGFAGNNFIEDHSEENIDYSTIHLWVENWGVYYPKNSRLTMPPTLAVMKNYLKDHVLKSKTFKKPIVLEEFGLARDERSMDPYSSTNDRDRYYLSTLNEMIFHLKNDRSIQGANFWAWSGESRPLEPFGSLWKKGDPLLGDPAHEEQGWYGVYDTDETTLEILSHALERVQKIMTFDHKKRRNEHQQL